MEVTYDDVAVPKSPFRVGVAEGCDPTRVRAHGPGLEGGLVGTANHFTVETRWAPTPSPNPALLPKAPSPCLPNPLPSPYSTPPDPSRYLCWGVWGGHGPLLQCGDQVSSNPESLHSHTHGDFISFHKPTVSIPCAGSATISSCTCALHVHVPPLSLVTTPSAPSCATTLAPPCSATEVPHPTSPACSTTCVLSHGCATSTPHHPTVIHPLPSKCHLHSMSPGWHLCPRVMEMPPLPWRWHRHLPTVAVAHHGPTVPVSLL